MGIENVFLRELPGLFFLILGVVAQVYLVRVWGIPRRVLAGLLLMQGLIFLANQEAFSHWMRSRGDLAGSIMMLWNWAIVPVAIGVWLGRRSEPQSFDPRRRAMLQTAIGALAAAPAVALGVGIIVRKDLVVNEVNLKFPGLPKDLQGLRLVQISDIHMSSFFTRQDLARAVDAANGLRADLMLVTGDLITDRYDPLDDCILELKRLRAISGLWGCLGNHEMHARVEAYATQKAKLVGLQFLRQEREMLRFGNANLNLVGVDHQKRDQPYLTKAAGLVAPDEFNILLSHNPDVFPVAEKQGYQLTISGHTHGGQINLEFLGNNFNVADLVTPFTKGTYHINSASLYVNSGLGTIGVPVRLGAPPEVTLITLCNS